MNCLHDFGNIQEIYQQDEDDGVVRANRHKLRDVKCISSVRNQKGKPETKTRYDLQRLLHFLFRVSPQDVLRM